MQTNRISEWLQVVGNFGVIIGLVLVAYQIEQNTALVHAELNSNSWDAWIAIDASKQDGEFAKILARSIEAPQDLDLFEMVALDGYLFTYVDQLSRDREIFQLGVFDDPLEKLVDESLHDYFGNEFARAWWAETKWKFRPDVVAAIDLGMQSVPANQDIEYYRRIKSRIAK